MNTATYVTDCAKRSLSYAERLCKDVQPHMAARKPTWGMGGKEIDCNHATFVLGHLSTYPPRLLAMVGRTPKTQLPASFPDLFKAGCACKDDPNGAVYPSFEVVRQAFLSGMNEAIEVIRGLKDADFAKPTPDERMREHFPTVGHAALFLLNNHVMVHLGQLSTWRRCMGLPAA